MNTTERKLVTQENITSETKSNTLKSFLGKNPIYLDFHSSLKTKLFKMKK